MVFVSPERLTHSILSLLNQWMGGGYRPCGTKTGLFLSSLRGQKGTFSVPVGPKNDILDTRDQNIVFTSPKGLTHSVLSLLDQWMVFFTVPVGPKNGIFRPFGVKRGLKNNVLDTRDQNIVFASPKGLTHSSRSMNGVYRPRGIKKWYFSFLWDQKWTFSVPDGPWTEKWCFGHVGTKNMSKTKKTGGIRISVSIMTIYMNKWKIFDNILDDVTIWKDMG